VKSGSPELIDFVRSLWLLELLPLVKRKHPPEERTLMLCDEMGNLERMEALLMATTLLRSGGAYLMVILAKRCAAPDLRLSGEYPP
jgi:type IV secretory pathway TraG/TraD family ATPase VirD4